MIIQSAPYLRHTSYLSDTISAETVGILVDWSWYYNFYATSYYPCLHHHPYSIVIYCFEIQSFCQPVSFLELVSSLHEGVTFSIHIFLYRKYVVYFSCHAMMTYAPRASALRERQAYAHS